MDVWCKEQQMERPWGSNMYSNECIKSRGIKGREAGYICLDFKTSVGLGPGTCEEMGNRMCLCTL